jgi:hypothetical protein
MDAVVGKLLWLDASLEADDQAWGARRNAAVDQATDDPACSALRDAEVLIFHLFWCLGGFAIMACDGLRHVTHDMTGHGSLGQFTVLWVFAIMACSALRHATDGLTCGALRHEAGCQLLWQDALFLPFAGGVWTARVQGSV